MHDRMYVCDVFVMNSRPQLCFVAHRYTNDANVGGLFLYFVAYRTLMVYIDTLIIPNLNRQFPLLSHIDTLMVYIDTVFCCTATH